ncbi:peptide-methionine (S)-S-oxide reductase [Haloarcula vallismortis]|uniref:Peptide methionine sulfoxide reductase MsrA n=2 Tax=Haloarcula vallismortis TaxID=28442 RepID=M0JSR4_HALVA|nr:peptide-methionine (S)-S-oxide reductase MsrA [Haloarcula vallismortis]EMA11423.1 methionine sulfoxide reductase A [Haloarcula vallismortis ATCC 29715]SDW40889.1 peptide-methionine (S)-S-oxide reductase [Haloarcula vallismortis]
MTEQATFAGGCFWCTESVFKQIDGVTDVVSGYAGGHVADPSYEAVCRGETGHAECVQLTYDPEKVSYEELLAVHFTTHTPTTKDREGNDVGTQYRSAVFYHNETQRETVEAFIEEVQPGYDSDIVTEVEPLETFYPAEDYHQDYFEKNPNQSYCQLTIPPKIKKLEETHEELLRAD